MHHHIGREENVKNLNPAGPDGSYLFLKSVFWGNQWKPGLVKELEEREDEYRFRIPQDKLMTEPHPAVGGLMEMPFKPFDLDIPQMFKNTFLSDVIVAFPMNDTYKDKEVEHYSKKDNATPLYSYSNDKIIDVTNRFPNSLRFVPFGRVVPAQDNAEEEMVRAVKQLRVKGFKLHPKSDGYGMDDDCVVDALAMAAKLDVPVLFHTSFISEVEKLSRAVNRVILKLVNDAGFKGDEDFKELDKQRRKLFLELAGTVNSLRVIVGHCGWHTSSELFDHLKHPCIYGEVSGIKGDVVRQFFRTAQATQGFEFNSTEQLTNLEKEGITPANLEIMFPDTSKLPDYHGWSSKVMFGTDFPFLDQNQAIDVFRALLSVDFPGTDRDIANFLGLTGLKVLFPHGPTGYKQLRTPPKDVLELMLMEFVEKGLKKNQVDISYRPVFKKYPASILMKDFHLSVKAEGQEEKSYLVSPP